jgi:hypothetical protein
VILAQSRRPVWVEDRSMKLRCQTACLPGRSLTEIAARGVALDHAALEVVAWPALGDGPFTATHLDVDGFDGVLSVEHDDPARGGTTEQVTTGLQSPIASRAPS